MDFESLRLFLPKYLSPSSEQTLFEELRQFPTNIDAGRVYSRTIQMEEQLYQGDGIDGALVTNLPSAEIRPSNVVLLSNTCDMAVENRRLFPSRICYSPIFNLEKYRNKLIESNVTTSSRVEQHVNDIRYQKITQIFFLPRGGDLAEDGFIFFDRLNSSALTTEDVDRLSRQKLFSLSNYGLYLFLFKLSIHFTRMNEGKGRE